MLETKKPRKRETSKSIQHIRAWGGRTNLQGNTRTQARTYSVHYTRTLSLGPEEFPGQGYDVVISYKSRNPSHAAPHPPNKPAPAPAPAPTPVPSSPPPPIPPLPLLHSKGGILDPHLVVGFGVLIAKRTNICARRFSVIYLFCSGFAAACVCVHVLFGGAAFC